MILHLTRDFPPRQSGGLSTAVGNIVAGLSSVGVFSRVVSFDGWGRRGKPKTDWLPKGESTDVMLRVRGRDDLEEVKRWALRLPPAIVHVHDPFLWELGAEIASSAGGHCVHTTHVLSHVQDQIRGLTAPTKTTIAQARAFAEADVIIAPSPSVAIRLESDRLVFGDRLRMVPLGVELPAVSKRPRAKGLLYVGRFSDLAGIGELPAIMASLAAGTTLTIAGGMPDNPRSETRWIETLVQAAKENGVELDVRGWLLRPDLDEVLANGAVLLAPNRYATFGLAVAEAMAAGIAVCAYRVSGLVDLIEDGVSGVLVEPAPVALAAVASELAQDDERRAAIGSSARSRIEKHFAPIDAAIGLSELYAELLG